MINHKRFYIATAERPRVEARSQKFIWLLMAIYVACGPFSMNTSRADDLSSKMPGKLTFDGFDIAPGQKRVAQALGGMGAQGDKEPEEIPLEFSVKGPPNSRAGSGVMAAEVGQEIAFLNIAAGVLADRNSIVDGPSGYTSRLSMDFRNESLVGGLDLKTKMRNSKKHSTVGIEFGPRLARRFRNGVEFFMKGSAEAVSRYENDGNMTATGGPLQRPEQVGVSGSFGIAR
ncbi:MAG TPA: hypothetical protein DEB70_12045 [Planctomycetaceae bacterium]|nr:hypothetical protein [Planctomycetaceae bacterium]